MSENINLIPANQLPVTESNDVNMLCLENGAVKQKSIANLGGASSWNDLKDKPFYSETDADGNETVHKIDPKYLPEVGGSGGGHWIMRIDNSITASEGIYDALENFLRNGIPVSVTCYRRLGGDCQEYIMGLPTSIAFHTSESDEITVSGFDYTDFYIHKDGNHDFYQD